MVAYSDRFKAFTHPDPAVRHWPTVRAADEGRLRLVGRFAM